MDTKLFLNNKPCVIVIITPDIIDPNPTFYYS